MNKGGVSLKSVAADVYSNPKMQDMPFEFIVSNTLELMKITGCPCLFEDREEVLMIKEHRAELPCDYYDIRQLRLEVPSRRGAGGGAMAVYERTDTYMDEEFKSGKGTRTVMHRTEVKPVAYVPQHREPASPMFKQGTNTFEDANFHPGADLTYKIQGNMLVTSIAEGEVRLAYRAIAVDCDGWPMVIDDAAFLRALKSYITVKWYTILRDNEELAKTPQTAEYILNDAKQEYAWNIAQAQNSLLDMSPETMRNIANILNDMLPRMYEHASGYNDLNKEHSLRVH